MPTEDSTLTRARLRGLPHLLNTPASIARCVLKIDGEMSRLSALLACVSFDSACSHSTNKSMPGQPITSYGDGVSLFMNSDMPMRGDFGSSSKYSPICRFNSCSFRYCRL